METLTRKDPYDLVWTEPIMKIAPRYGLSDRGLGIRDLACRRNKAFPVFLAVF
jgi:hypothetical protein